MSETEIQQKLRENKHNKLFQFIFPLLNIPFEELNKYVCTPYLYYKGTSVYFMIHFIEQYQANIIKDIFINKKCNQNKKIYLYSNLMNSEYEEIIGQDDNIYAGIILVDISEYMVDIINFLEGRYSNLSDTLKKKIIGNRPEYYYNVEKDAELRNYIYSVLYPNIQDRKQVAEYFGVSLDYIKEIYSKPDETKLVWNIVMKKKQKENE